MLDTERMLYRSQFILGTYFIDRFKSWKRIKIGNTIHLTVHPDLNTYQVTIEGKSVTLLGYILDPNNPEYNDSDIVNNLSHKIFNNEVNYFEQTYDFGGRWILIVEDAKETRLFADPAGLRQVVYTERDYAADFWCASQPGTIAEILNLEMDDDAVSFINYFKMQNDEYYWPGDSSPYKGIKHLLPNHFLELKTRACCRYWPDKAFKEIPLKEATEKCSRYLEGLMISSSKRYDLSLSLSSGWDSRLLLAACRKIKNNLSYLTEIKHGMDKTHADIRIPSKLLSKLKLTHHIFSAPTKIKDPHFKEIFDKGVPFAHDKWALKAEAYFNYYDLKKVAVVGTVSDIAKRHYHNSTSNDKPVTSQKLSKLIGSENDKFALTHLDKWIMGIGEIYNYNVLDLFYWEQRAGRWVATNNLEFDVGWKDIFIPYNCRALLVVMLSVDEEFRRAPNYVLYDKIIRRLWPKVLSEPINPHKRESLTNKYKKQLRRLKKALLNSFTAR